MCPLKQIKAGFVTNPMIGSGLSGWLCLSKLKFAYLTLLCHQSLARSLPVSSVLLTGRAGPDLLPSCRLVTQVHPVAQYSGYRQPCLRHAAAQLCMQLRGPGNSACLPDSRAYLPSFSSVTLYSRVLSARVGTTRGAWRSFNDSSLLV